MQTCNLRSPSRQLLLFWSSCKANAQTAYLNSTFAKMKIKELGVKNKDSWIMQFNTIILANLTRF